MLKFIDDVFYLVRGDTGVINVDLSDLNTGEPYVMQTGDKVTLTVRELPENTSTVLFSVVSSDGELKILPTMTNSIPYGEYSADIQVTLANGDIDTVWPTDIENKNRRKAKNMKNFCIVSEVTM